MPSKADHTDEDWIGRVEEVRFHKDSVGFLLKMLDYMDVSENSGTPKSSILIRCSIINHPFWGTFIFGNTHIFHTYILHRYIYFYLHTVIYINSTKLPEDGVW